MHVSIYGGGVSEPRDPQTPAHPAEPEPGTAPEPEPASARGGGAGGTRRAPAPGSWGELLGPAHLPAALVLAGGVAMYATNVYVTAALLPSAIQEIGGAQYFAWVTTVFLTASVIASMLVTRTLSRLGAARSYVTAFLIFAAGTLLNMLAPSMEALLIGRAIQGFGGGLLAGLGYAVIRTALPDRLWTRAAGLVSAMWGVGNLVGPTLGGVFAQLGLWRGAFAFLAALALILAWVSRRAVPGGTARAEAVTRVPVISLVLLSLAAAAFSVTAVLPRGGATLAGLAVGLAFILAFIAVERAGTVTVLPHSTYRRGNALKWVYLSLAILSAGAMTEAFIPLFGQQLGGMPPIMAGFLGAALSVGWTFAQLFSVNIVSPTRQRAVVILGPALLAGGLFAYAALQAPGAGVALILAWFGVLFAAGCGIGMAFPHLSVAAMRSTEDPAEGAKAAAGVSTTQLIANAVFSAVVGVLVSVGGPAPAGSAALMGVGIGVLAAIGVLTAAIAMPRRARPDAA